MRVNSFPKTVIEIVPPTGESFILAGGRNQRAFILPDTVEIGRASCRERV